MRAFHVCESLHLTRSRAAVDIRAVRQKVEKQCAAIEQQFFAGEPRLMASGRFAINGKHYE